MRSRAGQLSIAALVAAFAAVVAVAASRVEVAAAENTSFISGVVTSSNGPEAGVWVIAETKDFPAKLRKIVVTDDQGRFMLPELPPAQFDLWVRGYGLTDSKPVGIKAGQQNVKLCGGRRAHAAGGRAELSEQLLAVADRSARGRRLPRHRAPGQRHCARHERPGRMDQQHQGLHALPPGGQQADAHHSRSGQVPFGGGGLESSRRARPARIADELVHDRLRPPARPEDVRRLDQRHQGGRRAAGAAAPDRHRAQHRHHDVELGRQRRVRARRDRDRQAEPARESERAGLRRRHRQRQPARSPIR